MVELDMYNRGEPSTAGANRYAVEVKEITERSLKVEVIEVRDTLFSSFELSEGDVVTDVLKPYDENNTLRDELTRESLDPEDKEEWDFIASPQGSTGR